MSNWLDGLDLRTRARIQARVLRFEPGNLGDHTPVGGGVWEARLPFGPGHRMYFAKAGQTILMLLLGGDKASQRSDIRRARRLWDDYPEAMQHGKAR